MDDMEREALQRAEKMRSAFYSNSNVHNRKTQQQNPRRPAPKEEKPKKEEQIPKVDNSFKEESALREEEQIPFETNEPQQLEGGKDIFDLFLKDKEATLILLMIFFLYDENADPMLMMA
ncbi:MAG: hypothetical protein ACI4RL_06750, partial [Ruminococcus sp.]